MMNVIRLSLMTVRVVMRTKVALFFTFLFPLIFLFIYAGIFAHGNPHTVEYMFGQVLTLNILGAGFFGLGLQAVMQRERGVLKRYRLAPISALTIVTANLLANYLIQIPVVALMLFSAMFVFHMPFSFGFIPMIWFLLTIGIFAFAGYGLTLASVSNTMQEVQVYNNLAWFGLVFLSGITIPLPALPGWVQTVATFLPATYLVSMFQASMARSEPLSAHLPEIATLVVSGFAGLFVAWKLFRWEKDEKIKSSNKLMALALLVPILLMGAWMNIYANPKPSWQRSYDMMLKQLRNVVATASGTAGVSLEDFESPTAEQDILRSWTLTGLDQEAHGISVVSPGANGTQHALKIGGEVQEESRQSGAQIAADALTIPASVKSFDGIEFWVRSDAPRGFRFTLRNESAPTEVLPEVTLTVSPKWQAVRIPAPPAGTAVEAPSQKVILEAIPLGRPGKFSLGIDEIKTY